MALLSKAFLHKVAYEAVSKNGSMGLGGDAEGFEIANQGVTRRQPGEGPKANGGRSQLQTMDSYDQPQYKEAIEVKTGDDEPSDDPWGMNQTCDSCGSVGNWDSATCVNCADAERTERTVGPEQHEQMCPACDGNCGDCQACGGDGSFEAYLNAEAERGMNEEMPNFGSQDADGWDRQIAQGITNPGRDVSDEKPPQLGASNIEQSVQDYLNGLEGGFDPNRTSGTSGYDFTQDNPEIIKQLGLADDEPSMKEMFESGPDEIGPERIMWSPGEYGSNVKKVLQYLDKDDNIGNALWMKLNSAGPYAQVEVDDQEAVMLSNALTQFLQTARYDTKNVDLAEDVIEQIENKFGEIPAPKGFYHEGKEDELKKSSEKEKKEHPWASDKTAMRIAKDHMKLGEVFKIRKAKP